MRHLSVMICLCVCVTGCGGGLTHTFEMSASSIEEKMRTKFPLRTADDATEPTPIHATLSEPRVVLEEGDAQLGVRVQIVAEPSGKPASGPPLPGLPPPMPTSQFTGSALLKGTITYDATAKGLRISDPQVADLRVDQLPSQLSAPLSRLIEQALSKKFASHPIPLDDTTAIDRAAKVLLKSVRVQKGKLFVTLGW
jgi:hypothetical protein